MKDRETQVRDYWRFATPRSRTAALEAAGVSAPEVWAAHDWSALVETVRAKLLKAWEDNDS